ncbi:MAG TPA: MBL fold metallo-hydrolase [Vicinamibacterales bacterium]|nr:MBL fold metallo-hydrolase [Vicinamibacterales bacterium]
MRIVIAIVVGLVAGLSVVSPVAAPKTLTIYFIDVEGGQSTLLVGPSGESLLIDAGFPGSGTFQSAPGDPATARDANRVLAAAKDAGIGAIDNLLITHFHADHAGSVAELSRLIPIRTFIDHGTVPDTAEENVRGTLAMFTTYAEARARGRHIEPKPGDRLNMKDLDVRIVSSAGQTITKAISGSGEHNSACGPAGLPAQEPNENPRSTGVLVTFGAFTFLDVGDLSGPPLFALACPRNLVGPIDVYLVAHHGGVDAADPATFAAFRPTVAVVNNGATKGGAPETLAFLQDQKNTETWQLHRSRNPGARNASDDRIANLDTSTAFWLKVVVSDGGSSFTLTNGRTNEQRTYDRSRVR